MLEKIKLQKEVLFSNFLHLRLPFSVLLSPVFFFALSESTTRWEDVRLTSVGLTFFLLHFLLYPASHAYNSFYDLDQGSIGGLKSPPKVYPSLHTWALGLDLSALILAYVLGVREFLLVLIYTLASKAYSHPRIRLKRYPFLGMAVVMLCQGFLVYFFVALSLDADFQINKHLFSSLLSTLVIASSYPLTQVYQHEEDAHRGDLTISRWLGVKGTMVFGLFAFFLLGGMFYFFYFQRGELHRFLFMQLALLPTTVFYLWWTIRVFRDVRNATYENSMRLNLSAAWGAIVFFVSLTVMNYLRA